MQFPKLTPLQARLTATIAATFILILLFYSLSLPQFAYAAELHSPMTTAPRHDLPLLSRNSLTTHGLGHHHPVESSLQDFEHQAEKLRSNMQLYITAAQKLWQLHSLLKKRAPAGVNALENNFPQNMNIDAGQTQNWVFPKESIGGPSGEIGPGLPSDDEPEEPEPEIRSELRKRQENKMIYITVNTCMQPVANASANPAETDGQSPPQLQMWVSRSSTLPNPGPATRDSPEQKNIDINGGYAIFKADTLDDVYIGISAPNTTSWTGIWNYEIAASIDAPFHTFEEALSNLFFVDGDNHAALLVTNDTTQRNSSSETYKKWMTRPPPYGVFAHNQNDSTILGMQRSFCGLKNQAQIMANIRDVNNQNVAGMVNRGLGGKPKEQFYITDLNASSTYYGYLAMEGNSTASGAGIVGGGGKVWKSMNFATKAESNCALLYNLTFCSEVAYAVPSNPQLFDPLTGVPNLAALYDSNAARLYQNFNYSLQQVPCQVPNVQRYSLERDCDDCARAYKTWLCAVTIPRCEDFSSDKPYLLPRNTASDFVNGSSILDTLNPAIGPYTTSNITHWQSRTATNSSRNPVIDTDIRPGPYKEVLPCEDLCYDLMQSCPPSFGFACPLEGRGMELSYGKRSPDSGVISCSYLGAAYYLSAAPPAALIRRRALVVVVVFWMLGWVFLAL